jgi:hypothetical protein
MHSECGFAGPLLTPGFVRTACPRCCRDAVFIRDPAAGWRSINEGLRISPRQGAPFGSFITSSIRSPPRSGYSEVRREEAISTRQGPEDGGYLLRTPVGASLRVWPIGSDVDLDTPSKRGAASRVSPLRRASRVLRTRGESAGLVTNGEALRLIFAIPPDPIARSSSASSGRAGWVSRSDVPESYRLIFALASPGGVAAASEIFDAARLHQTAVTKTLRSQARAAIEDFLQCVIDRTGDAGSIPAPEILWRQALTIVYRLLFILKLESPAGPGGGFSFARIRDMASRFLSEPGTWSLGPPPSRFRT